MPENKTETIKLISEINEQLKYMSEIGVNEISADLPRISKRQTKAVSTTPPRIVPRADKDDRVAPPEIEELLPNSGKDNKSAAPDDSPARQRRNLLGGTKISDMTNKTTTATRESGESKETATPQKVKEAPKQDVKVAQTPTAAGPETLEDIRKDIGADCSRCELCEKRTQVVNSVGSETADLMIIGEAPGADEDEKGEPFVGRAGKLLTKILEAIDFSRDDVFIGNINRCRPPANRQPTLEESATCKPFLLREIEVVKPKVIVVLGNTATKNLLETKTGITKLRGTFVDRFGVKVMPTFHPAYLLRDPRKKREVWEDMKTVRKYLDTLAD